MAIIWNLRSEKFQPLDEFKKNNFFPEFSYHFWKFCFRNNFKAVIAKLLLQSPEKFLIVIRSLVTNTSKFCNISFISKDFEKKLKKFIWISKNQLIHLKKKKKNRISDYLLINFFKTNFIITFWHYYHVKSMFLKS